VRPFVEDVAIAFEVEVGDGVSAGAGDAGDLDVDEGAGAGVWRELLGEFGEPGVGFSDEGAAAVEADDLGRAIEGAEHDDDAAVFLEVRGGFGAAAGVILIDGFHGAEDAEGIAAFGGEVDVGIGGKGRGADEEDFLLRDPAGEVGVDGGELLAHQIGAWRVELMDASEFESRVMYRRAGAKTSRIGKSTPLDRLSK
jgi:hypothetical protein